MTDDLRTRAEVAAEDKWPRDGFWMSAALRQGFIAGALWHAAQRPTREQIARALHDDDLSGLRCLAGDERDCMEPYYRNADAVLALLDGGRS